MAALISLPACFASARSEAISDGVSISDSEEVSGFGCGEGVECVAKLSSSPPLQSGESARNCSDVRCGIDDNNNAMPGHLPITDSLQMAADRDQVLEAFAVSRETAARLDRFVAVLLDWQQTMNLVAPSTIPQVWSRHIADSLQLLDLVSKPGRPPSNNPRIWADLGSGAGFPGMVIACALAGIEGALVHLVESNMKKAAFLRDAGRETRAPVMVHAERIEKIGPVLEPAPEVITARALAPLDRLCHLVAPFVKKGAQALLMKGQDLGQELTKATRYWTIDAVIIPSKTDSTGRIMIVRALSPRTRPAEAKHGR